MTRQVDVKALVSHIVRGDGADKCRICMGDTSEGQVYLGDTVMMDGDKPVTLAELLQIITGVEMPLDDDLPTVLCSTCSASALNAADFRTLCRQAANEWDSTLTLLSNLPSKITKNNNTIVALICNNEISILDQLNLEMPVVKSVQRVIKKEFIEIKPKREYTRGSEGSHCKCPNCDKTFPHALHLYRHLKESADNLRACYVCAEIMTREDLVLHLHRIHKKNPYDCKKCPALFTSYEHYKLHLARAHAPGACTCVDCGRNFQSEHGFHAHISIHTARTCPGCDKLFRNQTCYFYHVKKCCNLDPNRQDIIKTKHKATIEVKNKVNNKKIKVGMRGSADKECICDYCGKKYAGKKFVAAHIQIVHMKNTHTPCSYCGKFLAAAHMTEHLKKHGKIQLFECKHCGITLRSRLGYVQHLRLHTGEKPYACKFCGETFSGSSRRSDHIRRKHRGDIEVLRHGCTSCPARFRLPYKLRKHMELAHGNGSDASHQFICNICQEKFGSCRGLLHHSRKHQKIAPIKKISDKGLETICEDLEG